MNTRISISGDTAGLMEAEPPSYATSEGGRLRGVDLAHNGFKWALIYNTSAPPQSLDWEFLATIRVIAACAGAVRSRASVDDLADLTAYERWHIERAERDEFRHVCEDLPWRGGYWTADYTFTDDELESVTLVHLDGGPASEVYRGATDLHRAIEHITNGGGEFSCGEEDCVIQETVLHDDLEYRLSVIERPEEPSIMITLQISLIDPDQQVVDD